MTKNWQQELKTCIRSSHALAQALNLPENSYLNEPDFPVRVPLSFLSKIKLGDLQDPLLLQILARPEETHSDANYLDDPLAETTFNKVPGLLHKYHGRVLLTVTQACAIHCRYCFRRNFDYKSNNPGQAGWENALRYIQNDTSIREVILSGGDPLSLTDSALETLVNRLEAIPHLDILRLHSRTAIVMPSRITAGLARLLHRTRLNVTLVTHCNHPNELDTEVMGAMLKLKRAGLVLLNQSVLLAKVNNNLDTLCNLSRALFGMGILPYYLHLLDKVKGTAHFDVKQEEALALIKGMQTQLPGYLVPRLAREDVGMPHKTTMG